MLADRGTLIYIYGNRDKERSTGGNFRHVADQHELDVGHHLHSDSSITVDGPKPTNPLHPTDDSRTLTRN